MSAKDVVEEFFRVTLANSAEQLATVYAPDVVIDIPFAPPGVPARYVGLAGLQERWAAVQEQRSFTSIDEVAIHETPNPEEIIVEFRVHGVVTETASEFALRFLMVVTIQNGLITASRDYSDFIAAATAYGRLPALLQALTAGTEPEPNSTVS